MSGQAKNPFVQFVRRYRNHPVDFVQDVWGADPTPYQADILRDVANPQVRGISARSGHGVGKSAVASWAAIHFLLTRFPCKIVVTAPTAKQLFDALFSETKHWVEELPRDLRKLLLVKSDSVHLRAAPESAFMSLRTSRAEQPEALQGVHSENVLLIVDEASGVPDIVFESASGSMSGENATTLLLGNPVHNSGFFHRTHTALSHHWKTYHISCLDSPLVTPKYVKDQEVLYGRDSNAFRVRVLGEFPLAEDDVIIPMGWIQSAINRDIVISPSTPVIWGVDVARRGRSKPALAKRQGKRLLEPVKTWRGLELMQLAGEIVAEYNQTLPGERPVDINIDTLGLGAGLYDRLREQGLPVRSINVSELPAAGRFQGQQFVSLKTQLWYDARAWFEARDCTIPQDQVLIDQLGAVQCRYTSSGKLQVEDKDSLANRSVFPDEADAFILTFAGPAARSLYGSTVRHDEPLIRNVPGLV